MDAGKWKKGSASISVALPQRNLRGFMPVYGCKDVHTARGKTGLRLQKIFSSKKQTGSRFQRHRIARSM